MLDTIPVPADSKFGAMVARRLNASRPISPDGSLAMSGPTGTGFAPLPANLRDRRAAGGACPYAFRIRAIVESQKDGDATKKRLVVEMLSSDAPMVTWNDREISPLGVEADGGLSPAADCNVGFLGWQRIHEGKWEDAEGFVGDIEVWLRLHLEFMPSIDEGHGPAAQSNTGWTLVASAKDDEKWLIPSMSDEIGIRELIRYYRVAKVECGAVTCQDLLGGLHFVEMYPEEGGGVGGASSGSAADMIRSASAFGLVEEKDDDGAVTGRTVVNCWWNAGGITMGDGGSFDVGAGDGVIYAEFSGDADGDGGGAMGSLSVSTCGGFSELNELQRDAAKYVFPLYLVSGGEVVDLRTAPQLQLFEEALS